MKIGRVILLIGMVLYVVSFFLTGVKDAHTSANAAGISGYGCAYIALVFSLSGDGLRELHNDPFEYFAVLVSGWINPVFLITMVLLAKPGRRLGPVLRIVLLFMFAACWIVFRNEHIVPCAGYFLWTAAMLLALFANGLSELTGFAIIPG